MEYKNRKKAILLLSDGTIFYGKSVYGEGTAFGEVCFNTGMTGYQEIYTDPSYFGQLMIMTNPHIGNYGVNTDESESDTVKISGLICKNFSYNYSRELADGSLEIFLTNNNLFAISDVDTRALVSYIRENGAMNAVITTEVNDIDDLSKKLQSVPSMKGLELASKVSTKSALASIVSSLHGMPSINALIKNNFASVSSMITPCHRIIIHDLLLFYTYFLLKYVAKSLTFLEA